MLKGGRSMRAPNWTRHEFAILVDHPQASDVAVTTLLPGRTADAVGVVRQGVHAFHSGMNTSMLSKMMLRSLDAWSGSEDVVCPVCGKQF
jgi:hypothetical protein